MMTKVSSIHANKVQLEALETVELSIQLEGGEGNLVLYIPEEINAQFSDGAKKMEIPSAIMGIRQVKQDVRIKGEKGLITMYASTKECPDVVCEIRFNRV